MTNWRTTLAWQVLPEPEDMQHQSMVLAKRVVEDMMDAIPDALIKSLDIHVGHPATEFQDFEVPMFMSAMKRYLKQYIDSMEMEDIFAQ